MEEQPSPAVPTRRAYPTDVSDDEWAFVAPYLTLLREDAAQREHRLREVFNGPRYAARGGVSWRMVPNDLPPWAAVYQQTQRWIKAGVFEAMVHDLRVVLRLADVHAKDGAGRAPHPTAVTLDGTVLQSTPESGHRAGYSGHKRKKGSKLHLAVDTLGHLLALRVTPADVDERAEGAALAAEVQTVTGGTVELAYVDQGYTGAAVTEAAAAHGIAVDVVKLPRRSAASCCSPDAGWWSARLRGCVASADWRRTTSACPRRSPACTSWPSRASCSPAPSSCSPRVHDTF